jgi:hypothetical protein
VLKGSDQPHSANGKSGLICAVLPKNKEATFGEFVKAADQIECRAFPSSIWSDQSQDLAESDLQINIRNSNKTAKASRKAFGFQQGFIFLLHPTYLLPLNGYDHDAAAL